jgi:hypothetical protein
MRDEDERRRNVIASWESIGKGRDRKRRGEGAKRPAGRVSMEMAGGKAFAMMLCSLGGNT